jgi:hypothetical protein
LLHAKAAAYFYSDTTKSTHPVVTSEVLDHHLETLTSRKDETTFETFARRLVEKFITPNLRPQTGPVGGGDGKTDAETYPVAQTIALRWYSPHAAPAHERWAFAFSAKKRWRHLHAYLDEFAFRHNRRKTNGVGRIAARVIEQLVARPPLTMRSLIDDTRHCRWFRQPELTA